MDGNGSAAGSRAAHVAPSRWVGTRRRDKAGRMIRTVLGIDLASAKWSSVGSASIEFDDQASAFTRVVAGAITWPTAPARPTPDALADATAASARPEGGGAGSRDGPQGWRDPGPPNARPGG